MQNKLQQNIMQNLDHHKLELKLKQRKECLTAKQLKISCVVPIFNEQDGITSFIDGLNTEVQKFSNKYELVLVDDGSRDNTAEIIESLVATYPIKLIKLSRNFGKEIAISAGLEHCNGEVAILIDSDFQHPFTLISQFLNKWAAGFDMVFGVRDGRENESIVKRGFTKLFYQLMQTLTPLKIVANAGDFRLLDRKVIDALNSCQERTKFMKGLYTWVGYNSIGVPFKVAKRKTGKSYWNFTKLTDLALIGITSFSNVPLRVWSYIGFSISVLSFLCAIFVIVKTLALGVDVPGYATLLVTIIFFGGIQLLSIGILGEYIARIFNEVKNRPTYIVEKKIGF